MELNKRNDMQRNVNQKVNFGKGTITVIQKVEI